MALLSCSINATIEATGVVRGEYGMVEALDRKQQEISNWKYHEARNFELEIPRERAHRTFAEWLTVSLQRQSEHERQRADDELALRKYRNGTEKGDD
uniref:hypothetical protein n=1 Tax=Burkholderia diffusa TaxID=488732 RepID=UPI001CC76E6A|nr:hypothetical protein [Burkholderia diffusa]